MSGNDMLHLVDFVVGHDLSRLGRLEGTVHALAEEQECEHASPQNTIGDAMMDSECAIQIRARAVMVCTNSCMIYLRRL
jgi:hypothetical protein